MLNQSFILSTFFLLKRERKVIFIFASDKIILQLRNELLVSCKYFFLKIKPIYLNDRQKYIVKNFVALSWENINNLIPETRRGNQWLNVLFKIS